MANLTARLKGLDYKQLLTDHGEKIALGVVALLAVLCAFGARWAGYARTPEEMQKEADEARKKILDPTANAWPEEKQKAYLTGQDVRVLARLKLNAFDGSQFAYSNVMTWPMYEREEPIREPEWFPVEELLAGDQLPNSNLWTSSRVILAMTPSQTTPPGGAPPAGTPPGGKPAPSASQPTLAAGDPDFDFAKPPAGATGVGPAGTGPGGFGVDDTTVPAGADATYPAGMGMGMRAAVDGRGVRYIAVRGIWPLRRQIEEVARKMNEQLFSNAAGHVEVLDFELERQKFVGGQQGWSGWEPVRVEAALDILDQTPNFDLDEIDSGLINDVMTMPLPQRIGGRWGPRVSHPRLTDFQLSQAEMERERKRNEEIIKFYLEQKKNEPEPASKGGFAGKQMAIGQMRQSVMSGATMQAFQQRMKSLYSEEELRNLLSEDLQRRITAVGRLLLFRYLDFDIEPGNAYRYRVRLTLRNPHFGREPQEVASPEVAIGPTRQTPWSQPTPPVIVPPDEEYFLADVEAPRTAPAARKALMDVYQWNPETGTMLNHKLRLDYGQFVGGEVKTVVIDPARQKYEEEASATLKTDDMLVDMTDLFGLDEKFHADLGLTKESVRFQAGIVDLALVANRYGELVALDPVSNAASKTQLAQRVQAERDYFSKLKAAAQVASAAGGTLESYAAPAGEGAASPDATVDYQQMMMMQGMGVGPNPIRKGGPRGRRGAAASMPAGYP